VKKEKQMKKALAFAATAILLGFTVMMLPLALETGPPTYTPDFQRTQLLGGMEEENRKIMPAYGYIASQPSNLLPSSLILISGLIVALSVYAILKRRIV
jgi:RsiW-degrading membrane proteinase PrsW (M82 family)